MSLLQRFAPWGDIRTGLLDLVDRMEDADLAYVPVPKGWSLGRTLLHIADAEDYWLHCVVAGSPERWLEKEVGEEPDRATIVDLLAGIHEESVALLGTLTEADLTRTFAVQDERRTLEWIIWHVIEHEVHHRGEISLAFGLLGRTGLDV
jgi:uncharacterized damage-inducible protein DinB